MKAKTGLTDAPSVPVIFQHFPRDGSVGEWGWQCLPWPHLHSSPRRGLPWLPLPPRSALVKKPQETIILVKGIPGSTRVSDWGPLRASGVYKLLELGSDFE